MDSSSPFPTVVVVVLAIAGFLIVFPVFWCFIVFLISRIGGWGRLAKRYSAGDRQPSGESQRLGSGLVGASRYRGVLTIHQNDDGFFLEVSPLFRIGHPRLFIPWSEISERSHHEVLWAKTERITIGSPPVSKLTLPQNVIRK
jgi:hypothetical protein